MRFKKNKVWLSIDDGGQPIIKNNKVLIKYQLDQEHEYWVNPGSVMPLESPSSGETAHRTQVSTVREEKQKAKDDTDDYQTAVNENAVCVFTDGASSGNPGPSGIGVVLSYGPHTKEVSKSIGVATNNIAELEAIKAGLREIKKTDLPVRIFTDSNYAYGVLMLGWKARKNQQLVESIKKLMATFKDLKFIKVKGHSGLAENERADVLATSAARSGQAPNA